ncbi:Uma2 family endonuclease [Saccharomonospora sp. NPDC006951]
MSIATEPANGWPALLRTWRTLDLPDGWKAEITEGSLRVSPPPGDAHNDIADSIHKILARAGNDDWGIYQTRGIRIPGLARLYIPDLLVMPLDAPREENGVVLAEHTILAVEITSKDTAEYDRKNKLIAYAFGGVPIYLLIDRWAPEGERCVVYTDPADREYRRTVITPFGQSISIPDPIALDLDTGEFR